MGHTPRAQTLAPLHLARLAARQPPVVAGRTPNRSGSEQGRG